MAENKKGVIVYADWIEHFETLEDEEAGQLIKHFFRYINDLNPECPNRIIQIAFNPIKSVLKRDLQKWENKKEKSSKNGKIGNLKKYHIDLYNKYLTQELTLLECENIAKSRKASLPDSDPTKNVANLAVSVSDSVSVNVSVSDIKDNIPEIKNFGNDIIDFNSSHAEILKKESQSWLESVSMQQKIPIEEIKTKIDEFVLFLKTTTDQHKNKKAFITHFVNWLPKQKNKIQNGTEQNSFGGKQQFRFSTDNAIQTILGDS